MNNLKQLNNKQLIESFLQSLQQESNINVIDKKFGNCYFLFEGEENSICHFKIKEIPGFIFGIWTKDRFDQDKPWYDGFGVPSNTELVIFTQYEREMDKFKPSRSGFCIGTYRMEDSCTEQGYSWHLFDMINIIQFMRKHPIKSYVYVQCQINNVWDELPGIYCLKTYISDWYYHNKYKNKKQKLENKLIKASKNVLKQLRTFDYSLEIYKCWSPSIHIHLRTKPEINKYLKDEQRNYKEEEFLGKFFDKHWNNISYNFWESEDAIKDKDLSQRFYSRMDRSQHDEDVKVILTNIDNTKV